ncbi:MAG: DNA-formamidopyrimidine glycosylase [Candidatus Saccharimonadales bacterium]
MPELPEVETVKIGLQKFIVGKRISTINYDWPKSFPNDISIVESYAHQSTITSIRRRAKILIIDLDSEYSFIVHLKMTGQLVYISQTEKFGAGHPNESLIRPLPDTSTRVTLTFGDGSKLFFNDQRKFGWMKLIPTEAISSLVFFQKLGPEPLENVFTSQLFQSNINRRPNAAIKAVLLDQTILAGVGNIYADESLWAAYIHPTRPVKTLSANEVLLLHKELKDVLRLAIKKGGSTDRNYVNAEGKKGSYLQFARVFRRENLPCPRCGALIIKTRVASRGTHICLVCQV